MPPECQVSVDHEVHLDRGQRGLKRGSQELGEQAL